MKLSKDFDEKLEAIIKKVYAAGLLNSPARMRDCTRQIKRLIALEIHGEGANHETKTV